MKTRISPLEYSDLHRFFRDVWERSQKRNRRMSQASLARHLGCSPPTWTNFLHGRRMLSEKMLLRMSKRLEWSPDELSHALHLRTLHLNLEESEFSRTVRARTRHRSSIARRKSQRADSFASDLNLLSLVLIESVKLPEYRRDPTQIADRLGFKRTTALQHLQRLIHAGILARTEDGSYEHTEKPLVLVAEGKSLALRKFYREMLSVASRRIRSETTDERYIGSETFAFDTSLLPQARQIIDRCLDELSALALTSEDPQTVYHAGVQLFEVLEKKSS